MKKLGFTLAEMMGVVIIISVLALLIVPTLDNTIKKNKQGLYETQINSIKDAASIWAIDHRSELPDNEGDFITIYLRDLKQGGYIDDDISDPRNGEPFSDDMEIIITKKLNNYVYDVIDNNDMNRNPDTPIITLNGERMITLEVNGIYTELGASAKTVGGKDVTSELVISGSVDTSHVGTYTIYYNLTYKGFKAKEVTRTVVVMDKNPAIVLYPNETTKYEKSVAIGVSAIANAGSTISSLKYKLDGGAEQNVVNKQIVINTDGEHTVEVIAVDDKGNTTNYTSGVYKIDSTAPTITFAEGDAGVQLRVPEALSYDLLTGVTVADNNTISIDDVVVSGSLSAIADEYTITYIVSDEALNTVTKVRKITVVDCDTVILGKEMTYGEVVCHDPDKNPRFVGADPDNYVSFNGELWRIIGVFNGQTKIIRNDYYSTSIYWDSNTNYSNNWAIATLQLSLNNTTDGYIKTIQTNDSTSYGYIDLDHEWNIGGYDSSYTTTGTRSEFYNAERSETISSAMTSHLWKGAIGLMYPSDYGYASSGSTETCDSTVMYNWSNVKDATVFAECVGNSWLYDSGLWQWTLTPRSDTKLSVFSVDSVGEAVGNNAYLTCAARPALYLKSNVKIVDGTGTRDDPYILDMDTMEDDIVAKADPSDLATNDPDGNLRYVGADPDNYVWFNKDVDGNPERWRIIGVFDGQVKIVKHSYYAKKIEWDTNGTNDWATATLQTELNGTYLVSIQTNDPTSYSYIDLDHIWNIGGYDSAYATATRSDWYNVERSEAISSSMTSHLWTGTIGLMYPSDYGYSTSGDTTTCGSTAMYDVWPRTECILKSWLYDSSAPQWTLTPRIDKKDSVIHVYLGSSISFGYYVKNVYSARPVLYLKSDVRIIDGTGTYDDPFVLGM